jgi:hypothetical protein
MRQLVTFGELSNNVDTTGISSMRGVPLIFHVFHVSMFMPTYTGKGPLLEMIF